MILRTGERQALDKYSSTVKNRCQDFDNGVLSRPERTKLIGKS